MLKKRVSALDGEVRQDYVGASKQAVLDYLLLDPEERERLGIPVRPELWRPRVVRAPVPWHQSFLQVDYIAVICTETNSSLTRRLSSVVTTSSLSTQSSTN